MKIRIYYLLCCLGILGFSNSCFHKPTPTNQADVLSVSTDYEALYRDSVFLGFEGDLLHEPTIVWNHYSVYMQAYNRMARHLTFGKNCLKWDFKSAKELRISQNIFDYVIYGWNYDNKMLQDTANILKPMEGHSYRIEYNMP